MEVLIKDQLQAVVTREPHLVGGSVPVFIARDEEEQERLALYLSRILGGNVHDLENGVYLIVRH
ncbi:MAG: hypothetical protein HPY81_02465 [Firmicutes bacterium]|nr:hypothetical protein [Bacillota bacterium]